MTDKYEDALKFMEQWKQELIMMSTVDNAENVISTIREAIKLASVAQEMADSLTKIDGILQWMANKEADYSADELRAMASKAITFQGQALAKLKEIK